MQKRQEGLVAYNYFVTFDEVQTISFKDTDELREDISYRAIVDKIVKVPEKSDTRDTAAIKRIATAYLKLFFPNMRSVEDIDKEIPKFEVI